jgi:type VI protein secretion system component Hcp
MLIHQESVGPNWHLAGSAELVRRWHPSWYASNSSPHCFTLIRQKDALSSHIETAMAIDQVLPKVGITTPSGKVTLWNARIVGIGPWTEPKGSSGKNAGKVNTHELERVSFTFMKIDIENSGSSTSASDDWSAYPP